MATATPRGVLTSNTQIYALGVRGSVTYAEVMGNTLSLFDGTSGGTLLCTLAAGERIAFTTPVVFVDGLYALVGASGIATIHIG